MESLIYRNMHIQSRPVRKLLAKIILPAMVTIILACFRAFSSVEIEKEPTLFEDYSVDSFDGTNLMEPFILYCPDSPFIKHTMKKIGESVKANVIGMFNFLIDCRN